MNTIRKGSRGEDVRLLQKKLGISSDGIFGDQTDKALREYQRAHGLTNDGICGPHTWESLGIVPPGMRAIDEIVIHCSATREGKDVSADTIDASHKARNFSSYVSDRRTRYIGYHYLVHRDGRIEECRPLERIGCHASGHNARSIGVCYIGGLDSSENPKDTRTEAQKAALVKLIRELKRKFPAIKRVIGHRDTSPDLNGNGIIDPYEYIKACPCFDAEPEYGHLVK